MQGRTEILQLASGGCKKIRPKKIGMLHLSSYVMEEKIDGHKALLHIGGDLDRGYLTSKRISKVTGKFSENGLCVPDITQGAHRVFRQNIQEYTVFDGEVTIPGHPFESVQTVLGSHPEKAVLWQEQNTRAVYTIYDVLFYDGTDIRDCSWAERMEFIHEAVNVLFPMYNPGCLRGHNSRQAISYGRVEKFFNDVVSKGGEGIVLKNVQATYGEKVWKWKALDTFDVVISGYKPGKKKYENMIGSVMFSGYDPDTGEQAYLGKTSGMEDGNVVWNMNDIHDPSARLNVRSPILEDHPVGSRSWFTVGGERLIGQVMEVRASKELTRHGRLRHPRFVRMRPDKSPEMCPIPSKRGS